MTRTQFCAPAGVGVLVRANYRALAEGGEVRLIMPISAFASAASAWPPSRGAALGDGDHPGPDR